MRREGQPQTSTPVKVLGEDRTRIRKLEFRAPRVGWRFNVDNEGGFGYVRFNTSFDLDTFPDPPSSLAVGGTWGGVIEDDSGDGLLIGSTTLLRFKGDTIVLEAGTSPLTIFVHGKQFEFRDDGTIHIPTGGSVIADL